MVLAQIPGADQVITTAAETKNWVIVLLVCLILGMCAIIGVALRYVLNKLSSQDKFINNVLVGLIEKSNAAMNRFASAIEHAPCGKEGKDNA